MAVTSIDKRTKQLQQAAGLSTLYTGIQTTPAMIAGQDDLALQYQLQDLQLNIEHNLPMAQAPEEERGFFASLFSFGEEPPAQTIGTKDHLQQLIDRQLANETLAPHEVSAVKAAMSVAAYDVDLSQDTFSTDELGALGRFNTNLDNNLSLTQIANSNFISAEENARRMAAQAAAAREIEEQQQQAAAEAAQQAEQAALETSELNAKVSSMLVYGGYLPEEHANNPIAVAHAMKHMMTIVTPHEKLVDEEKKIFANFDDWSVTPYALEYANRHLSHVAAQNELRDGTLLQSHLESGNPELIKLAQGYLAVNDPSVKITGEIDQATFDAATADMREPLTRPAALYAENGSVRIDNMMEMAVRGQLHLPIEALSPELQQVAMSYPLAADREPHQTMSREKFIALRLIADDPNPPAGYQAVLDAENASRATASLNVTVVKPDVAVVAETQIEAREETNNPLGLRAAGEGAREELITGTPLNNAAEGVNANNGELQFTDTETGLASFVSFMKESAPDGHVTLHEAMTGLHYATLTQQEAFLGGASPVGTGVPPQQHADRIETMLGVEPGHKFDLNNPAEVSQVLTGLVGYNNREAFGRDFIDGVRNHETWGPSIERVANGGNAPAQPEEAPADTIQPSPDSARPSFTGAALGVDVMKPDDPALSPDRRLAANNSGPTMSVA